MLICAYSDFGFSSLPHTQRTKYRCKWEYFSLLFKIEFAIVEAESHFAQLSLAQNSNLHRFPLVAVHLYESLFLSSRSLSFLPSRVCVCQDHTHCSRFFTHYHNSQIVWRSHRCKVSLKRCSRLKTSTH